MQEIDAEVIEDHEDFPEHRYVLVVFAKDKLIRVPFQEEAELGQALLAAASKLRQTGALTDS
jgi:hypothetical protein